MEDSDPAEQAMEQQLYGTRRAGRPKLRWVDSVMLEIWELIAGRQQHKIGKDGGDFLRKTRPDKGCSATDDDDDDISECLWVSYDSTSKHRLLP
jgi:hypothetical protein